MKIAYPASFEAQSEGGFTVTFPDFPGAITKGDTLEQARINAAECLSQVLDVRLKQDVSIPLPLPRHLNGAVEYIEPAAATQASLLKYLSQTLPNQPLPKGVDLEYKALRDEILLRINLRQQHVQYTLTFFGVLVGVGLLKSSVVALLYPPFAFLLALGWKQNDDRIRDISLYIRERFEPYFIAVGWETWIRMPRDSVGVRRLTGPWRLMVFSHAGVLFFTQLIAIGVGSATSKKSILEWILLSVSLLFTLGVLQILRESLTKRAKNFDD